MYQGKPIAERPATIWQGHQAERIDGKPGTSKGMSDRRSLPDHRLGVHPAHGLTDWRGPSRSGLTMMGRANA
ncbi:MAG: hypothetical protein ACOYMG_27665, partial [Candidatus Methylumidiphilus sp.]